MKITASQLRMIIKEEVKRAKRVNLHENPLAMVDSDLGNALTDAVKDAISSTVALRRDIDVDATDVRDSLDNMEISSAIEDMVMNVAEYLSEQGILPSDVES
jgi:hypothetical protein